MSLVTIVGNSRNGAGVNQAAVDDNGLLTTKAFTQSFELRHTVLGRAFNLNTGDITFTSGGTSYGASYLKNNGEIPIIITSFIYLLGNSTGGSGDGYVTIIANPTGGTLISAGTALTPANRAPVSKRTLEATWLKASDSTSTVTGGETLLDTLLSSPVGRNTIPVFVALDKGASLAIKYQPQTGNTSQTVQIAMACYEDFLGEG
jgi:hypothetical protein